MCSPSSHELSTQPSAGRHKRAYPSDDDVPTSPQQPQTLLEAGSATSPLSTTAANNAFRNVSACDRCRKRKNRCDQQLPACAACTKVGTRCVGLDPITKQEIPRSYVYYLETRLIYFESLLVAKDIAFDPPDAFDVDSKAVEHGIVRSPRETRTTLSGATGAADHASTTTQDAAWDKKQQDTKKLNHLVSDIGMVSVQGASDPRTDTGLHTSGISFAKVVFAAVKSSVSSSNQNSERNGVRPARPLPNVASSGSTMRDSCFGLQTRPTIRQASFPDRPLGEKLVRLYFEHANPQIPILHRESFMELFHTAYAEHRQRTPRELYMLNIVFAIGAGIIFGSSEPEAAPPQRPETGHEPSSPTLKRTKLSNQQQQPEEYHAAAIVHLEAFLGSTTDRLDGFGGGLEELQAVLLLAGFALLRPVAPGLWYIVGVAVRLAIDLGLHFEDGIDIDSTEAQTPSLTAVDAAERGRRQWVRDLRRRLWWSVYSFDRLVSTCVGRPFSITDQVVTTEFPSELDDRFITRGGFVKPEDPHTASYKHVAHHYFRLRLLQSEILQVLQYQQAQIVRKTGTNSQNEFMHARLSSPFLIKFTSFKSWRRDIDRRLWEWKESAPSPLDIGVKFSVAFLELNYWQAVIMLYRQSLAVPAPLVPMSPKEEASSPSIVSLEENDDDSEVFLKVAEAGQKVLKLYRQLHRVRLVNYTYLATHHLFMAGISFLYSVWHSPLVRSCLTLDDVDFTILAATSVLGDLTEKCPPAEACKDAFERMSRATVQMAMSTTGFGPQASNLSPTTRSNLPPQNPFANLGTETTPTFQERPSAKFEIPQQSPMRSRRPPPKFDMNLRDLFPEEINQEDLASQSFTRPRGRFLQDPNSAIPTRSQQQSLQGSLSMQAHPLTNRINTGLGINANQPVQVPYASQQQQQQQQAPSQIQMNTGSTNQFLSNNPYGFDFASAPGLDFLQSIDSNANSENTGFDLGFGPGLDFQHDWSDGNGVDIFDGFFFGNAGI